MEVSDIGECFVCGQGNPAGLQAVFCVDGESRSASARVTLPERFQGWQGVVHGGIVASLLDEAAIYACRSLEPQLVTAEITVRYKKPVPVGRELQVRAQFLEQRKRIMHVRAWVEMEGQLLAEADSKVFCLR
ncbi:acyl-CoA thioesterase [Desulfuromonas versatilis]|uniref:Acyl-CoA thioesterase n=1 Tax=Desulfuromonas versatilis TaxID=2802975 RepID=A0ABN6E002_9BACT|nr:PaaI family thioesterase [Desulfuromonas versatilis]BCR04789.1 acyl-CoA thioesterase [Desulfuromonas versatilis]